MTVIVMTMMTVVAVVIVMLGFVAHVGFTLLAARAQGHDREDEETDSWCSRRNHRRE